MGFDNSEVNCNTQAFDNGFTE